MRLIRACLSPISLLGGLVGFFALGLSLVGICDVDSSRAEASSLPNTPSSERTPSSTIATNTLPDSWWDGFYRTRAFNGEISDILSYAGDIIAVGLFDLIGSLSANHIAQWDGQEWHALAGGLLTIPRAWVETQAGLVVTDVGRVRVWNGSTWTDLGGDGGTADQVLALAEYQGDLYASYFASGIKRWTGAEWVTVATVQATLTPSVQALAVFDGALVAAGRFAKIDTTIASAIASWDGTTWSPLGAGMSSSAKVRELVATGTELIASGDFSSAGGTAAPGIASWNGVSWTALPNGNKTQLQEWNGDVIALSNSVGVRLVGGVWEELPPTIGNLTALGTRGAELFVAKPQPAIGGNVRHDVMQLDAGQWVAITPISGRGLSGRITAMVVYHDTLVVAGTFLTAGDLVVPGLAMWDGSDWHRFPGTGLGGFRALQVFNGDLIGAGSFGDIAGVTFNSIARWDGASWHPLGQGLLHFDEYGVPRNARVERLAVYGGELIAAGDMGEDREGAGATPTPGGIARWDGVQWNGLGDGLAISVAWNFVQGLAVNGGELVASAEHICMTERGGDIARWDGNTWTGMEGAGAVDVATFDGDLYALRLEVGCTQGEGTTLGFARWEQAFWNALSSPGVTHAAKLSTLASHIAVGTSLWDGTTWTVLGSGVDGPVEQVIEYKGALYFGGDFNTAGGLPSQYIARWDTPTPVTVEDLQGWAEQGQTNLRWRLSLDGQNRWDRVGVRRAATQAGPYQELASLRSQSDMTYVDSDVEAGQPYWYRIVLIGDSGTEHVAATIRIDVPKGAIANTVLHPVNDLQFGPIEIRYRIGPRAADVRLDIYDVRGRHIRTLRQGPTQPGDYVSTWDRRSRDARVSRGLYFVRLSAGATRLTRKIVLVND